jgi:SAM-dependent methyltransferase
MSDDVADYYDENTRAFLARGEGGGEGVLHRAVWGEGVATRSEALRFVDHLILREIRALGVARPRILDLGCGVGASLLYLLERGPCEGFGISNSAVQLEIARARGKATWLAGDFEVDPLPSGIDLAYGIESFVHARSARGFFENVAKALRPGARLVLVDDFLAAGAPDRPPVRDFVRGWHARSLLPAGEVDGLAAGAGLSLVSDRDLTPFLSIDRPRDLAIAFAVAVLRPLPLEGHRYQSLVGGNALRQCLKRGLVTYRARVWEKSAVS